MPYPTLLDHHARLLNSEQSLHLAEAYEGKVVLIVNTASACAFTPQYQALEKLFQRYQQQGLVILGFPCNNFGKQEQGAESTIQDFCQTRFGVSFPMFEKVELRGNNIHPLFQALANVSWHRPRWNFHKYLLGREGQLLNSFYSWTSPDSRKLTRAIEKALKQVT